MVSFTVMDRGRDRRSVERAITYFCTQPGSSALHIFFYIELSANLHSDTDMTSESEIAPWEVRLTGHLKDLDDLHFEQIPIEEIDHLLAEVAHHLQMKIIMSMVLAGFHHDIGVAPLEDFNAAHEVLPHAVETVGAIEDGRDHPSVGTPQDEMTVTGARRQEHEGIRGRHLGVQAVKDHHLL